MIPPKFAPTSTLRYLKMSTYRSVLFLISHVVDHWRRHCFVSAEGLDIFFMHALPLSFFGRLRTKCGGF